jgi:hypothetical protein
MTAFGQFEENANLIACSGHYTCKLIPRSAPYERGFDNQDFTMSIP